MSQITVSIIVDEWYPVYGISEPRPERGATVEIDSALFERYEQAEKAFDAVQTELAALYSIMMQDRRLNQ